MYTWQILGYVICALLLLILSWHFHWALGLAVTLFFLHEFWDFFKP